MALHNSRLNALLLSYGTRIRGYIVDEGHIITQWGSDFRRAYAELDKLRAMVPPDVPFYVTSATMPPEVLQEIQRTLHIDPHRSFHLNLGNDRPNVTQEMRIIRNATDFSALDFIVEGAQTPDELPRTLIFVNKIDDTQLAWKRLQEILPVHLRSQVSFLNSRRTRRARQHVLNSYREGHTRVMVVTEIGGMVSVLT